MSNVSRNTLSTGQVEVAICGNPNCGKTTIFNAITGLRQRVGNYPGVTVEKIFGQFKIDGHPHKEFTLVDIPGNYSLSAFSPDEYIAARALSGNVEGGRRPDVIVCVIDATNLERGLYLLFQVLQIGSPVVVGLNMIDLARRHGTVMNIKKMSRMLGGIPVVPMVGNRGKGVNRLKHEIGRLAEAPVTVGIEVNGPEIEQATIDLEAATSTRSRSKAELLRILFDRGGPAEKEFVETEGEASRTVLERCRQRLADRFGSLAAAETLGYSERVSEISSAVVKGRRQPEKSYSDRVDRVLLNPVLGPIILVALMTLIFQSIFSWAEPVMDLVDASFSGLAELVGSGMSEGPLRSLITSGVIGGVGSVLIFLPQIMILFLFIAILEDSGYMPRAAFLVDRAFRWCGLSGKSFIPMLSSFACAVPGIMATRTIEDRKLRLITIMVAPLMACSARLPVYAIMIAAFIPHATYLGIFNSQGLVLTGLYFLGIVVAVLVSYVLKKTLFKTGRGTFIMDMPSYKLPSPGSILVRVFIRAKSFVLRAGTVILAITIIIWALGYYPHSSEIADQYELSRSVLAAEVETSRAETAVQMRALVDNSAERQEFAARIEDRLAQAQTEEEVTLVRIDFITAGTTENALVRLLTERRQRELTMGASLASLADEKAGAYLRDSYFARLGRVIEPVFRPLGWDWKITMAVLSSFPAREVIIATLGTIFNLGTEVDEGSVSLVDKMRQAQWDDDQMSGKNLFSPAVALSVMVFFALSCQCGPTVVTIRQETGRWIYSALVFGYMTALAYAGALIVYQLFTRVGF
jgi:ferrous iron transport protein B